MRIQLVNTYLGMMDEGLVPYIKCGGDKDHPRPFVRPLDENYPEPDDLELWCLACPWTKRISITEYRLMKDLLALHNPNWMNLED